MPLLFRSNASRAEKIFTLVLLAGVLLGFYGLGSGFVPEQWVIRVTGLVAVPLAAALLVPVVMDRHPANKIRRAGILKRTAIYAMLAVISFAFSWAALSLGAPAVFTALAGIEREDEFVVLAKSGGGWPGRGCNHSAKLKQSHGDRETSVCLSAVHWGSIHAGDLVRVSSRKTMFGGRFEGLRKS